MALTSLPAALRAPMPPDAPMPAKTGPPATSYERALTLAAMGGHDEAISALRDVNARAPEHAPAWQRLAELLRLAGKDEDAAAAAACAAGRESIWPPASDGRAPSEIDAAERALREHMRELAAPPEQLKALHDRLRSHETDTTAMRLLARLEWRAGNLTIARDLFERALDLAPDYEGARVDLAQLLRLLREDKRAVDETGRLLTRSPANPTYRALHADALRAVGDLERAMPIIEQLIREEPGRARFRWVYAQALRFAGRGEDSARELRACLQLQPGMGEAYLGLAELRGDFLVANDIAAMRRLLRDNSADASNCMPLHYALGQALERAGDFPASFAAYEAGAALSREIATGKGETYEPLKQVDQVHRRRAAFTADLFAAHPVPAAKPQGTPIFVLGMPRSGSTLVEQILASHNLVEATMELPLLGNIMRDLALSRLLVTPDAYPGCVRELGGPELKKLGARYLEGSAIYRRTKRAYFVDKRPWNWLDAGLIHLILPHAKIVDVRREPMASCFAMYKHMMANESTFPCGLGDLAHYYTQYVDMMAHYERVMPGRIHFLSYERLVEDTETEIRRLLDYCGLSFEEGCLRFWQTGRAVATPSSEQVRRPIYRDALQQWRNFEPWLTPLKESLSEAAVAAGAKPQPQGYESALTLAAMSMYAGAVEVLRAVTAHAPTHPGAWQKYSELLRLVGEDKAADDAGAAAGRWASEASKWQPTRDIRTFAQIEAAERKLHKRVSGKDRASQMEMLRELLLENPTDAAAMHMLSRLEWQDGDQETSLTLLKRTVELSPFHQTARAEFAVMLMDCTHFVRALEQSTTLVRQAPGNAEYRAIHSDALKCVGDFAGALTITEDLLREQPRNARFWSGYGQLLQYAGRRDDSARAFRTCLEISPAMGQAWWGLADLKAGFLTDTDVAAMRACLRDAAMESSSRMYIYHALGDALERAGDFAASFAAYQQGARLFRGYFLSRGEAYSEDALTERLRDLKRVFTARNLAGVATPPAASVTPVFIVGMPRAGSTLLEQILASHSQVEGTRELPLIGDIRDDLAHSRRVITPDAYPDCLLEMSPLRLAELGERYLRDVGPYRNSDRPYFIDKRPWNWLEAGLIHLILPHAKIIDIRREPMAACFAMFKQVLAHGADFSCDLHDLGRYYTEYAGLMEHWQSVMPGRIHFVQYERLVEDTEGELRRVLTYCGLPFEEGCLRFWETKRVVATPSAEQVRRPIYRDAIEQWRNFEPWLGPLKAALSQPSRA